MHNAQIVLTLDPMVIPTYAEQRRREQLRLALIHASTRAIALASFAATAVGLGLWVGSLA
jgi:hypothetical protein